MPTAKVTKNVSAATGGGNVLCSTLISIKTKAWLYSFGRHGSRVRSFHLGQYQALAVKRQYADDALKFRVIRSWGGCDAKTILWLNDMFDIRRDRKPLIGFAKKLIDMTVT